MFRRDMPFRLLAAALALAAFTLPATMDARAAADATAAPALSRIPAACGNSSDFVNIVGQGALCEADRQWVVRLQNGHELTVAPPDAISAFSTSPTRAIAPPATLAREGTAAAASTYVCVDPTKHQHASLFYARFSDRTDNYAADLSDIQQQFRDADANYLSYDASTYFGIGMHLNVECNADGTPKVREIGLSTPFGRSNFGSIVSDMQNQGYASSLAHYWIWTDGNPLANLGYAGQSTVIEDDAPGIGNVINSAAAYSINYGYRDGAGGARIFTHENGHAMGAVQLSAPDSTGEA